MQRPYNETKPIEEKTQSKGVKRKRSDFALYGDFVNALFVPHYPEILLVLDEGTLKKANSRRGNIVPRLGFNKTEVLFSTACSREGSPYVFINTVTNPYRASHSYLEAHRITIEKLLSHCSIKLKAPSFEAFVKSIPKATPEKEKDIVNYFNKKHGVSLKATAEENTNNFTQVTGFALDKYVRNFYSFSYLRFHPDANIGLGFVAPTVQTAKMMLGNFNRRLFLSAKGIYLTNPSKTPCLFVNAFQNYDFSREKINSLFLESVANFLQVSVDKVITTINAIKIDDSEVKIMSNAFEKLSPKKPFVTQTKVKETKTKLTERPKKRPRLLEPDDTNLLTQQSMFAPQPLSNFSLEALLERFDAEDRDSDDDVYMTPASP